MLMNLEVRPNWTLTHCMTIKAPPFSTVTQYASITKSPCVIKETEDILFKVQVELWRNNNYLIVYYNVSLFLSKVQLDFVSCLFHLPHHTFIMLVHVCCPKYHALLFLSQFFQGFGSFTTISFPFHPPSLWLEPLSFI